MAGLNLHHACHREIMTQYCGNLPTWIQAIGPVSRLGQKETVIVDIICLTGPYSAVSKDKACRKIIPEMLFKIEDNIPSFITQRTKTVANSSFHNNTGAASSSTRTAVSPGDEGTSTPEHNLYEGGAWC
ncbi:hypothetical protein QBC35DRAFT_545008 [Podospora australis]|uniref:Uncharacterized protein n=1 Tax=Podospora australis TaxID=1536484 RepID=A0AAN6WK03_9PEZI|nr:hypothetical protein QBC35DRAFT_545008 [Podospora australis]